MVNDLYYYYLSGQGFILLLFIIIIFVFLSSNIYKMKIERMFSLLIFFKNLFLYCIQPFDHDMLTGGCVRMCGIDVALMWH